MADVPRNWNKVVVQRNDQRTREIRFQVRPHFLGVLKKNRLKLMETVAQRIFHGSPTAFFVFEYQDLHYPIR